MKSATTDALLRRDAGESYTITADTLSLLSAYDWSLGNVRELRSCLRHMVAYSGGHVLVRSSIPDHILQNISKPSLPPAENGCVRYEALELEFFGSLLQTHFNGWQVLKIKDIADRLCLSNYLVKTKVKQLQERGFDEAFSVLKQIRGF